MQYVLGLASAMQLMTNLKGYPARGLNLRSPCCLDNNQRNLSRYLNSNHAEKPFPPPLSVFALAPVGLCHSGGWAASLVCVDGLAVLLGILCLLISGLV